VHFRLARAPSGCRRSPLMSARPSVSSARCPATIDRRRSSAFEYRSRTPAEKVLCHPWGDRHGSLLTCKESPFCDLGHSCLCGLKQLLGSVLGRVYTHALRTTLHLGEPYGPESWLKSPFGHHFWGPVQTTVVQVTLFDLRTSLAYTSGQAPNGGSPEANRS